jgi:WD40 repeat protein
MPAAPHRCALLVVGLLALPAVAHKFVSARAIKHDQPVFYSTALSPQGNLLVAANPDFREIHLADPHTGKWLRKFALAQAHRLAFLPDGQSLLAASGRSIVQMDVTTGKQTQRLAAQPRDLTGLAVHPAGDRFVITNDVGQLQVHHLATGKTLRTIAVSESGRSTEIESTAQTGTRPQGGRSQT